MEIDMDVIQALFVLGGYAAALLFGGKVSYEALPRQKKRKQQKQADEKQVELGSLEQKVKIALTAELSQERDKHLADVHQMYEKLATSERESRGREEVLFREQIDHQCSHWEGQLIVVTNSLQTLETTYTTMAASYEKDILSLKARLKESEDDRKGLHAELNRTKKLLTDIQINNAELRGQVKSLTEQRDQLERLIDTLTDLIPTLNGGNSHQHS